MSTQDPTWSGNVSPPEYPPIEPIPVTDSGTYTGAASSGTTSTTEQAKQEAAGVAESASGAAAHVTRTTKEQAAGVASDAKQQAGRLADQTRQQVTQQASTQKNAAVSQLRSLGDELKSMAERSDQSGPATKLAQQGASAVHRVAGFLDEREPGQLLDEVRDFARRHPGTFLLGAALAGVAAGRLTRGAVSSRTSSDGSGGSSDEYGAAEFSAPGVSPQISAPVAPSPYPREPEADYSPAADYGPGYIAPPAYPADPLGAAPTEPIAPVSPASAGWIEPGPTDRPEPGPGPVTP